MHASCLFRSRVLNLSSSSTNRQLLSHHHPPAPYNTSLILQHHHTSTPARHVRHSSTSPSPASPRVAIIGSGPAGFYTARHLARHLSPSIDMYERLPVPYGLVRFGVAPDHPEVKNCIDEFAATASSAPRSDSPSHTSFRFLGNLQLGVDLPLSLLRAHYDVIIFAYGASQDRELGLSSEHAGNVYSARAFVGWYNGLPEYKHLNPSLDGDVVVIGQGNVALDCARILLSDPDTLAKTDITSYAIDALRASSVRKVSVVGRRGPVQASFTIKEVRELMNMPGVNFGGVDERLLPELKSLPRPKRRLMELLKKGKPWDAAASRQFNLDFCLRPVEIVREAGQLRGMRFQKTRVDDLADPASRVTDVEGVVEVPCSTAMRSIGYKAEAIRGMADVGAAFDERTGTVKHDGMGRVRVDGTGPNVYCAGWVKRGPTGVIASTMTDAFETAEAVVQDWQRGMSQKDGWVGVKADAEREGYPVEKVVEWSGWEKIDEMERALGRKSGKPREKLNTIEDMTMAATSA